MKELGVFRITRTVPVPVHQDILKEAVGTTQGELLPMIVLTTKMQGAQDRSNLRGFKLKKISRWACPSRHRRISVCEAVSMLSHTTIIRLPSCSPPPSPHPPTQNPV